MQADEIRRVFTQYFVGQGHRAVVSAPLVPPDDLSLLFTSAGMVPFKPYFLGRQAPPGSRLTSVQKCFRVADIDAVGDDSHLTFFEMLGNFSFGDYFKAEAQAWAWELLTQVLGVPPERLVTTVFQDDDEAYENWRKLGVPADRIFRYGEKENYWFAGEDGPCGPCSEIHYDLRPETSGDHPGPAASAARYLEVWNLVFMQFQRDLDGSKTPLPKQNIDTGAGLERWAMMLQDKPDLYETDLFLPLLEYVASRCERDYARATETERRALRVVAEHGRAVTFLIADGVLPSNERRGYVLRRLIRRALYMAQTLGIEERILSPLAAQVRGQMSGAYAEVSDQAALVERVLDQEEERFRQTLARGHLMLTSAIALKGQMRGNLQIHLDSLDAPVSQEDADVVVRDARRDVSGLIRATVGRVPTQLPLVLSERLLQSERNAVLAALESAGGRSALERGLEAASRITGAGGFLLYDTYGFPPELTREIAAQAGLGFDEAGFEAAMAEQRERSRAAAVFLYGEAPAGYRDIRGASQFSGYGQVQDRGHIIALVCEGESVPRAEAGTAVEVVLERTPFYPEGGGQVGDQGRLLTADAEVRVQDTQSRGDLIAHIGEVVRGGIAAGEEVTAVVAVERRHDIMRNHTATHLLHAALRAVLGDHVRQAGSMVAPDRLRFDYTQAEAPGAADLAEVERLIHAKIRQDIAIRTQELSYEDAVQTGAMAIFGEKYGTDVRVVEVCDPDPAMQDCFSKELCGGTHVPATGFIGGFQIVSEGSVGAGVRRIEALTGVAAEAWRRERLGWLNEVADLLRSPAGEAPQRLQALQTELNALRHRLAQVEREASAGAAAELAAGAVEIDGVQVVSGRVEVESAKALRTTGDEIRNQMQSGVIVLGAVTNNRPALLVMVTRDLTSQGLHAGNMIREIAKIVGGGGGGRPDMAQAGGKDPSKLDAALAAVPDLVRRQRSG